MRETDNEQHHEVGGINHSLRGETDGSCKGHELTISSLRLEHKKLLHDLTMQLKELNKKLNFAEKKLEVEKELASKRFKD